MTFDCDPVAQARLVAVLQDASDKGLIRFGVHMQDQAMMTCLVPAPTEAGHMHFVDGASGGYALAASRLDHSPPS